MSHYLKKIKKHKLLEKSFNYIIEKNSSINKPYHDTRHLIKVFNTALKISKKYDIGFMVGIICPLPDYLASKVMSKVKKNLVEDGLLIVSSSAKMMGEEDPLSRFLAEYTTAWFLNFRTNKGMSLVGKDAGYKVLDVIHEPMDYNKIVICQNV